MAGLAAFEGGCQRLQRAVVHGDDMAASDEDVDLAGAGDFGAGVPKREVHDQEEIIIGLVELWALDGADDVFQVERVEAGEAVAQGGDIVGIGLDDVGPGDRVVLDDAGGHPFILATEFQVV